MVGKAWRAIGHRNQMLFIDAVAQSLGNKQALKSRNVILIALTEGEEIKVIFNCEVSHFLYREVDFLPFSLALFFSHSQLHTRHIRQSYDIQECMFL